MNETDRCCQSSNNDCRIHITRNDYSHLSSQMDIPPPPYEANFQTTVATPTRSTSHSVTDSGPNVSRHSNRNQSTNVIILPTDDGSNSSQMSDSQYLDNQSPPQEEHSRDTGSSPEQDKSSKCNSILETILNGISHLCKILFTELIPWIMGCYLIYYAFKNGGLGLGFSAFLVLVSIHGLLRWWMARHHTTPIRNNEEEVFIPPPTNNQVRRHRHLGEDDSETDLSDDESIFNDLGCPNVIVSEPPPSYDTAANPTLTDLSLSLEAHLKPKDHKNLDLTGLSPKHFLPYYDETRRGSTLSAANYFSSETEDNSLPSYSDAIKKIKRKKKKSLKTERHGVSEVDEVRDTAVGDDVSSDVTIAIDSSYVDSNDSEPLCLMTVNQNMPSSDRDKSNS